MIDDKKLKSFVVKVQNDLKSDEGHIVLNRFMCHCLMAVRDTLPQVAQSALDEAWQFWGRGNGSKDELLKARLARWAYLESKGRSVDIIDREDAAIRATLCVLYADFESEEHSDETMFWFADMFDRLEVGVDVERFMVF